MMQTRYTFLHLPYSNPKFYWSRQSRWILGVHGDTREDMRPCMAFSDTMKQFMHSLICFHSSKNLPTQMLVVGVTFQSGK